MSSRRSWLPNTGLLGLAFRRVFSRTFAITFVVFVALWLFDRGEFAGATRTANESMLRATRRESTWIALALLAFPVCLYSIARTGERWQAGDRDWIGSRAVSPGRFLISTWFGAWLAGVLIALTILVVAEISAGGTGPADRLVSEIPIASPLLVESDARTEWTLDEQTEQLLPGRLLVLELRATPGAGPTARVRWRCQRQVNGESTQVESIVSGRSRIELRLPPSWGTVTLSLEKLGTGSGVAVLSNALTLFEPINSERSAAYSLLMHVVLWFGGWASIALGLGFWVRPLTATALTLALQLPVWSAASTVSASNPAPLEVLPGAELWRIVELLGDGFATEVPTPGSVLGTLLFVSLGQLLARVGLKRGGLR